MSPETLTRPQEIQPQESEMVSSEAAQAIIAEAAQVVEQAAPTYAETLSSPELMKAKREAEKAEASAEVVEPATAQPNSSEQSIRKILSARELKNLNKVLGEVDEGQIPSSLALTRDWNKPSAEHEAGQLQHISKGRTAIEARLATHESAQEAMTWKKGVEQHNAGIKAEKEAFQEAYDKELYKEVLNYGRIYLDKHPEVAKAVRTRVEQELNGTDSASEPQSPSVAEERQAKAEQNQSEYASMLRSFDSEQLKAQLDNSEPVVEASADVNEYVEAESEQQKQTRFGEFATKIRASAFKAMHIAANPSETIKDFSQWLETKQSENESPRKFRAGQVVGAVAAGGALAGLAIFAMKTGSEMPSGNSFARLGELADTDMIGTASEVGQGIIENADADSIENILNGAIDAGEAIPDAVESAQGVIEGADADVLQGELDNVMSGAAEALSDTSEVLQAGVEQLGFEGDTIWDHAEKLLEQQGISGPTDAQINDEMYRILELNDLTVEDAKKLPVGFKFRTS